MFQAAEKEGMCMYVWASVLSCWRASEREQEVSTGAHADSRET